MRGYGKSMGKEERVRAITKLYYANPKVQEALLAFSKEREVVPRYFEGFGKRPDTLQYVSDISGLVNRGATSFHASEEIWHDPLAINAEMSPEELSQQRKSWDLLLDIDSPFLDCSKIAAELIIKALEQHGVKHYGIKFSGSKGFHILVPGNAFPEMYDGKTMKEMFPEWPRAMVAYLMHYIRQEYNVRAAAILANTDAIEQRTSVSQEELTERYCLICNTPAKKGTIRVFTCPVCSSSLERRDSTVIQRKLRCLREQCSGIPELVEEREYYYCENDTDPENEKLPLSSEKHPENFDKKAAVSASKIASLDLVLVAPRHLFRMPYSLHEKTALASVVLTKSELESFSPRDAHPLTVQIKPYLPEEVQGEARRLLSEALEWKKAQEKYEQKYEKKTYEHYDVPLTGVTEVMFPESIKKLLQGLKDGKKRGLFILITFLKSLQFSPAYIEQAVYEWNTKNEPPLKEGYIKSQLTWHLRQKKKILPPNYDNQSFYKDLNLLSKKPEAKNPLVEVMRKLKK